MRPILPLLLLCVVASGCGHDAVATPTGLAPISEGLVAPVLPATLLAYSDARLPLPRHFSGPGGGPTAVSADNTPASNVTTDAGATLGLSLIHI